MKKSQTKPAARRTDKTGPQTQARLNQRSRRRVVQAVAGAVVGGVIAGPIGAALGAAVGATSRRAPRSRMVARPPVTIDKSNRRQENLQRLQRALQKSRRKKAG